MSTSVRFERSHEIVIDAPAGDILDYVSNPNSWPEWIAASHHIDSPPRPLAAGERFRERWHTRTGEVLLDWLVTECDHPRLWVAETRTEFIGAIIVRYEVEPAAPGCRYRRTLINPARPPCRTIRWRAGRKYFRRSLVIGRSQAYHLICANLIFSLRARYKFS